MQKALEHDRAQRQQRRGLTELQHRYDSLTPREREIAERLVAGESNKVVAIDLGLSERTIELHRAHVMEKMVARGLAQLVQMILQLRGSSRGDR